MYYQLCKEDKLEEIKELGQVVDLGKLVILNHRQIPSPFS